MTNTKYNYLSIPKALELGYPDLRGTKKDERPFCRYIERKGKARIGKTRNQITLYYDPHPKAERKFSAANTTLMGF